MVTLNTLLDNKSNEIVEMNEDLSSRFDSTVSLLVNIIELKQSSHRGHSERVAGISTHIARKMELPEHMIKNIEIAAKLHELGIVSLPADEKMTDVTNEGKSRKVTKHPLVGEMLLKGFPGFEVVAEIIRHSHENVNGSGIPDGLTGDHIPIGSRIISVASYYDHSVLSNTDCSKNEILIKVEKEAGVLFDEDVVDHLGEYIHTQKISDGDIKTIDCTVFALKDGMELASDIYSESGINLLRKGAVLDKEILQKILKFHNVDPIAGTIKIKQS
jgi:response regulator RpfG family c-di-GMP phosphodiesterase